jgi:hypothetical protein
MRQLHSRAEQTTQFCAGKLFGRAAAPVHAHPPSCCGIAAADYAPTVARSGFFAALRSVVQLDFIRSVPPGRSAPIEDEFV